MWKYEILAFGCVVECWFQRLRVLNNAKNSYVRRWDTRMSIEDGFGNSYLEYRFCVALATQNPNYNTSFSWSETDNSFKMLRYS